MEVRRLETGVERHRVHFGSVVGALGRVVEAIVPKGRLWVLLDEWSDVPMDLQPLLADFVRRSLLPVPRVTIKIGAIEHRSLFRVPGADGQGYIGIEVGADAAADLDLDDFMVFGNDADRAKEFFRQLLLKHVLSVAADAEGIPGDPHALTRAAFTQRNAFDEFVRAAEGVPRDAINILSLAARHAIDDPISVNHVRSSARRWYNRDKEAALPLRARDLLNWTIDEVIGERRARAFLLEQSVGRTHPLVGGLYDQRVLHVIKKSVAAHDQPGVRFDVYALDYGCYVELMATARAPQGLFEADTDGEPRYVDVPQDDYRSIRTAILDLADFERAHPSDG